MSDQTKPRVWREGDEEPIEPGLRLRDRDGDEWVQLEPDSWSCNGDDYHAAMWEDALDCGPLSEVQTSSPVHGPSEDGNASERPNAGQETAAEDDPVVLAEHYRILAAELGQAAKEAISRADAAEAKVREEQVASANLYGRVFTALGLSVADPWHGVVEAAKNVRIERDTAAAKLDEIRAAIGGYFDVDIDEPDPDNDIELDQARRALKAVLAILDREPGREVSR